jgi:adenylate kinase family enzyme
MRRVLVIGSGGAGKSTVARRLGETLAIPVIHLDRLYWRPGWVEPDRKEWAKKVNELISQESWILDGNYSATLAARLAACDTVVFLDLSRLICLWRVFKRALRFHGKGRPDMAPGCAEKLDLAFLLWVWRYPARSRGKVLSLLEAHRRSCNVICLRTQAQVERFLQDEAAAKGAGPVLRS